MSKETVKIVEIDTNPAVKSLKDLRKELKDFKDQMANLEEGSDAFLEVANKAGEVKHQIDEINESIKGASADFGDMVGNITNVAAGITGAFQAVAGGLQAMGVESKAIDETIARMQGLMAVTQGLSAIDNGIKSFDKLKKSIESSTAAMKVFKTVSNPVFLTAIVAVITAIGAAWNKWGEEIRKSLPWLDNLIKKFDGTAAAEIEKMAEKQREFNEELAVSNSEVAKILEQRKLDLLTPEAKEQIKQLNDELVITENELLKIQDRLNKTKDKNNWVAIREEADAVYKRQKEIKELLADIYDNPKYKKANQEALKAAEKERIAQERKAKNGLPIGSVAITPLEITPLAEQDTRDIGERLGKILADAEIKARNEKWKEKIENGEALGNEIFENIKSSIEIFSESSLGITDGWIASLNVFQTAFQQTMKIVKDEGDTTWESYTNVAITALSGIGSILNTLSNEQDASNEEGFEQMKKLQIAATVMNMLSGIMSAWTSAMSPNNAWMMPWGQIAYGTAMSGMIAGIGAAQIQKIQSQTMKSANPNTNINAKTVNSMIVPPVQYSSAVQGASTEGAIKDTKVYVTETDIVNTMSKVKVQETENTY